MMKKATQEEAVAVIKVFWDIKMCPVPPGFDARLVRPCIKRLLEKHGYYGPLTIEVVGTLTDVPIDVLREVYSSGIPLIIVPYGTKSIPSLINGITPPAPANFMIISDPSFCADFALVLHYFGYNALQFPYDGIQSLIMADSGALEEDTHESPLWDCLVCARDPPGQGFENFTTHLSSEEHQELLLAELKQNVVLFDPEPPISSLMLLRNLMDMNFLPPPTFESPRDITGYHGIDSEAVMSEGETFVFWDINKCPVPPGCDARLVGPCIKLFLKKKGCTGPLTIVAIGVLTEIPHDILSEVYSSGIALHNVPYGSLDISNLIYKITHRMGPRRNIMVISNAKVFACNASLPRCNLLKLFPVDSLLSLFLADSGALEEDKCSETGKPTFWICSLCYPDNAFQGFEWFTTHLSSKDHLRKLSDLLPMSIGLRNMNTPISEPHEIDLGAVTSVFWDIKMCPIPPGCDPRRVGPCIKQFLENKCYSGPLTITVIGALTDVPHDILRGFCSSGIALHNVAYGFSASEVLILKFADRYPPPANIMVISNVRISPSTVRLQTSGYNFLRYDSLESLILTDSGPSEEDKCSETGESTGWVCSSCYPFLSGQGFANFTSHIASIPHERRLLDFFPREPRT